ncbi:calpain cysteine peptidase, partial [Trypanosoma grayi]|uniref:calpain cysteine peptidase n=1 Tax=Trypanosoma grayi TaxID=71804 RepID=UPI0004F46AF9
DDLNDRARELAIELKEAERAKFLDPRPNGVPIADVPIDSDGPFRDMEIQRLLLCQEPIKNATAISHLEDAMNERALELAAQVLEDERAFLDPAPLGIPLPELPLDENAEFLAKEADLRELIRDGRSESPTAKALRSEMLKLAYDIAADELARFRASYLNPELAGRLVDELPLNADPEFMKLEKQLRQAIKNPQSDPSVIQALKENLNVRALLKAKEMNKAERKDYLNPRPLGVAVEDLPLDTDEKFAELEEERARLKRSPRKNHALIADVENALNARAMELAEDAIRRNRSYLDPFPEGVPLQLLPLDTDPRFLELEKQRVAALSAEPFSAEKLRDVEKLLNDRAHELAVEHKRAARERYVNLDEVSLTAHDLSLDTDVPFHELEARRFQLLAENLESQAHLVRDLEEALGKRVAELAQIRRDEQRQFLDEYPLGIPLSSLPLDKNAEFLQKEAMLRQLRMDPLRAEEVAALEDELNAMVHDMAAEEIARRYPYLDPRPEGVLLRYLPLQSDPKFASLLCDLENIQSVPQKNRDEIERHIALLNDRAHELAREKKWEDRQFLNPAPEGIPLTELPLDEDAVFATAEEERRRLMNLPGTQYTEQIKNLENQMQKRVTELAKEKKNKEFEFLDKRPQGIDIDTLHLDEDPIFRETTQKLRELLKQADSSNNAEIEQLKKEMHDRVHELAKERKLAERAFLDQNPEGVPLSELPLDEDEKFMAMEEERRRLIDEDPRKNAPKIASLERDMNERAHELAKERKLAER